MDHARVISDLGGYLAVAAALGADARVTCRWGTSRSIPARRFPSIVRLAQARGLAHITLEALMAGYRPVQEQLEADRALAARVRRREAASRASA